MDMFFGMRKPTTLKNEPNNKPRTKIKPVQIQSSISVPSIVYNKMSLTWHSYWSVCLLHQLPRVPSHQASKMKENQHVPGVRVFPVPLKISGTVRNSVRWHPVVKWLTEHFPVIDRLHRKPGGYPVLPDPPYRLQKPYQDEPLHQQFPLAPLLHFHFLRHRSDLNRKVPLHNYWKQSIRSDFAKRFRFLVTITEIHLLGGSGAVF